MDQIMIGKFIAACRKEQGLTQAALAEKLGVSDRAVSKWENGRNMPDVSIIPELCALLKIDLNELFAGERLSMDNYKEIAQKNLLEMRRQEEKANKRLLNAEKILGIVAVATSLAMVVSGLLVAESSPVVSIVLCSLAGLTVLVFAFYGIKIEHEAGYYECPECGERYIPDSYWKVCFAPHFGSTRKMTCPKCGKRAYQKKVLTKE